MYLACRAQAIYNPAGLGIRRSYYFCHLVSNLGFGLVFYLWSISEQPRVKVDLAWEDASCPGLT